MFDAGSIQSTLDLDRDPFQQGLDQAQASGQEFADSVFTAMLSLDKEPFDTELDDARATGGEFADDPLTANLLLDADAFDANLETSRADLDEITAGTHTATLGIDPAEYDAGLAAAQATGEDFDLTTYTANLAIDEAGYLAQIADAEAATEVITDVPIVAHLTVEDSGVAAGVVTAEAQLEEFSAFSAIASLDADPLPAERNIEITTASVEEFDLVHATASVDVDTAAAEAKVAALSASVVALDTSLAGAGGAIGAEGAAEDLGGVASGLDEVDAAATGVTLSVGQMITSSESMGLMFESLDELSNKLGIDLAAGGADVLEFGDALNIAIANQGASVEQLMEHFGELPSAAGSAAAVIRGLSEDFDLAGIAGDDLAQGAGEAVQGIEQVDGAATSGGGAMDKFAAGIVSAGSAIPGLWIAIGVLATALIPIGAVAIGVGSALAGAFIAATAGLGAFALAAEHDFGQVTAALSSEVSDWQTQLSGFVKPVVSEITGLIGPLLNDISPLVAAGADSIKSAISSIGADLNASDFKGFISWMADQAPAAITTFDQVFQNMAGGFSKGLEAFSPFIAVVENGLLDLSTKFESFNESNGMKSFVSYIEQEAPTVGAFFEALIPSVGKLIAAFAPLGDAIIRVLTPILTDLGNMAPVISLATGAMDLLARGIQFVLTPLEEASKLMGDVGGWIGGLVSSVAGWLGITSTAASNTDTLSAALQKAGLTANQTKAYIAAYGDTTVSASQAAAIALDTQAASVGLTVTQFKDLETQSRSTGSALVTALDKASTSAGITSHAMAELELTSGQAGTAISTAITTAASSTQSSFASATNAVTAFSGQVGITGDAITNFYAMSVAGAQGFANNVQAAIKEGYNPTLIEQIQG